MNPPSNQPGECVSLPLANVPGLAELLAALSDKSCTIRAEGKGENKGQGPAFLIAADSDDPLALHKFQQVQGKNAMGFVNYTDVSRLLATLAQAVANFRLNLGEVPLFAFGGKHGNVCGGAFTTDHRTATDLLAQMLEGDLLAIFGGFIIVNFPIDKECAETIIRHKMPDKRRRMIEGVIAPSFTDEAKKVLADKNGRCKLLANPALSDSDLKRSSEWRLVQVRGAWLAQKPATYVPDFRLSAENYIEFMTARPNPWQIRDMLLADAVCRTSNSNTITIADRGRIVANATGQQSRVAAAELAIANATRSGHDLRGTSAVGDSFFPFTDAVNALIVAGVNAILTSSGADRDDEVIELCKMKEVALGMCPDDVFRGFSNHSG